MSTPLSLILTDAGNAALWNAKNTGVTLDLTHIQFGSGNRVPGGDEVQLVLPQQSIAISGGSRISNEQIRISGTFTGDGEYEIREIGVWAGAPGEAGSVLFAYWSTADSMLAAKYPGVDFVFNYDMAISNLLPGESLNIIVSGDQSAFLLMIADHEAKADPHPQYVTADELETSARARRFFFSSL